MDNTNEKIKKIELNQARMASSSEDLLDAQAHVWNHILSYINSMALRYAVELRIPDAIHKHGKPITLSQLADALCINKQKSHGLYRLMRILVHNKFFDKVSISGQEEREEAYSLTRVSRLLLRDDPSSLAPFALAQTDPIYIDPFLHMSEWFRDECPSAFFTKNGMDIWEFAAKDGIMNQGFNEAMASDARFVGSILVRECKHVFEGLKTMVDVAGGTGEVAKAVAGAFPGLKCIVLDQPHVVAGMEGSENVKFVGGDMFEFIPPADAVFLKWTLHDWGDENCVKILRKCKEAIVESKINGKKVIIVDIVVDEEKQPQEATETHLFMDLLMLAHCPGKERSEKEWAKLFAAAGFKL
ncbi:8-hydroxyquercetin 8-O-methyltransferase-like isoform X2 [Salvia splendens]|uniref:8-hydroxyquercetin 8-O-methyltransferase-like isoform X2 n=1 Tax=Salvia splendens TaxID=180675 RepID=UPI001C2555B3|nr:8-hydroxyquercetin 8-O-methyltransferase-like isoform X2 [Salvia splendens]